MQVQTKTQLTLISPFLDKEIDYKNDNVEYITTSSNDSNIVHKGSVTSNPNNTILHITEQNKKNPQQRNNALSFV